MFDVEDVRFFWVFPNQGSWSCALPLAGTMQKCVSVYDHSKYTNSELKIHRPQRHVL